MKETQGNTPLDKLIDTICERLEESKFTGFTAGLEGVDTLTNLSILLNTTDSDDCPYFVTLMAMLANDKNKIDHLNNIISTANKLINLLKEDLKSDFEEKLNSILCEGEEN